MSDPSVPEQSCARENCRHPVEAEGLCIFHLPKPTIAEKRSMNVADRARVELIEVNFRKLFFELIEQITNDETVREANFSEFDFPMIHIRITFTKHVNFSLAIFKQEVEFWDAKFKSSVLFFGTTFVEQASFYNTEFQSETRFQSTAFLGGASFVNTVFSGYTTFLSSRFVGRSIFTITDQGPFGSPLSFWGDSKKIDFRALRIDAGAEVIFARQSMAQVSFLDTDLRHVIFRDVHWYRHGRRRALSDEFKDNLLRHELEKVAANYRDLVVNCENKRDFEAAEDFHIGEMEVRRKRLSPENARRTARKLRQWCNAYSLYWLSSRYGTSYTRAVSVLALLILLFAGIFLHTGFVSKNERAAPSEEIKYTLAFWSLGRSGSFTKLISDYGKALLYTTSILVFDRQRLYEPVGAWSQFWTYVATVLLPAQGALILFAIRRRFRR